MIDTNTIFTLSPLALGAIPVIVVLVQVFKGIALPSRFAPLASILSGVAILAIAGLSWQAFVIQGIIVGLAASGLYAGGKATFTPAV